MSVAISWANKKQLAKCDIMVSFPISSHIFVLLIENSLFVFDLYYNKILILTKVMISHAKTPSM